MVIKRLFQQFLDSPAVEAARSVDHLQVSTCVLLIEMAAIDDEFDESERAEILEALRRRFHLSASDARELLEMAEEMRRGSRDLWRFTNAINAACTAEQKQQMIEEVWRVVYADGKLDGHEDYLAHKMGRLLNLPHPLVIAAKLRARNTTPSR